MGKTGSRSNVGTTVGSTLLGIVLTDAICDLDLVVFSVLTKTILILDRIKINLEGFKPANLQDLF